MAEESHITKDKQWHAGEDKDLEFEIFDDDVDADPRTMANIAGASLRYELRRDDQDTSPAVLVKTTADAVNPITVTGTYNAVRAVNTQRVVVPTRRANTIGLEAGTYYESLWQTDSGNYLLLSKGAVELQRAGGR